MADNKYLEESHNWYKEYCNEVIRFYKERNEFWLTNIEKPRVFSEY